MTIGEKIKELRLNKNISIEEISKTSEIPLKKLKRIETDLYIPTREEVQKLCEVFDVEEKEVINEETRKDTIKIEAKISMLNFSYWIMNAIVYLFFIIVAFIPALKVDLDGSTLFYSFNSLLMRNGNPLVIVTYVFSTLGLIVSLTMCVLRFVSKIKLSERQILYINILLLVILVLVIATIFTVIITYSNDFVSLIIWNIGVLQTFSINWELIVFIINR